MQSVGPLNLVASGTINPARFVKVSGDGTCAQCGDNERPIGISVESSHEWSAVAAAVSGQQCPLNSIADVAYLELGSGGATAGDWLKSDADGKGVVIATTAGAVQNVGAVALQTAAAGGRIRVKVFVTTVNTAVS